jgi:TRAP-type C4-dicarboxylate transport system substrate-binding protein
MHRTRLVLTALIGAVALVLSACGSGSSGGSGAASIKLADTLPVGHYISKDFTQYFIDQVEKKAETAGKEFTVDFFPDGQLGEAADQIDNINNGVFDAGLIASPYDPAHMPLGDAFNLPFTAPTSDILANAYYDVVTDKDSVIYQTDFEENNLVPMAVFALPTYQIAMTSSISGIDALQGKKIRSGGGVQNDTIKSLGGTPVTLTTAEQYEGLQRGIIDGGIFNTPSMVDNKTAEVLKAFTTNANMGGFNGGLAISDVAWSALPAWAQDVLIDAGKATTEHFSSLMIESKDSADDALVEDFGLTPVELSEDQLAALQARLQSVRKSWTAQVAKQGADGDAALSEALDAVAAQE